MLLRAIIGTGKKNFLKQFLKSFRAKKMFYAIIAIKNAFWYINICQAPGEVLKPSPFRLGFQHLPWSLADVNA